jgi:hypothetical protein
MFIASKLLAFLTQPLAWVAALLLAGLVLLGRNPAGAYALQHHRRGRQVLWLALALLLLQGWEPLPDAFLRRMEDPYARTPTAQELLEFQGVVVLGGALEPSYAWVGRSQVALNEAAERMVVPLELLRQKPDLQILFTGGEGALLGQGLSEADRARIFYQSVGVPPERLWLEDRSRTTYENAVFSAKLPGVNPQRRWLLLTSAWHMRRAMATFESAGWKVTPYAVDFATGSHTPWTAYSLVRGSRKWGIVLHEVVGLLAYQATGRA